MNEGIEYEKKFVVTEDMVAKGIGLDVKVLSTPSLILAMEITCHEAISGLLRDGETTVGMGICMKHLKPTKIGEEFVVRARLTERDGRKLKFRVDAYDNEGKIGEGEHQRFIVDKEKFASKLK